MTKSIPYLTNSQSFFSLQLCATAKSCLGVPLQHAYKLGQKCWDTLSFQSTFKIFDSIHLDSSKQKTVTPSRPLSVGFRESQVHIDVYPGGPTQHCSRGTEGRKSKTGEIGMD